MSKYKYYFRKPKSEIAKDILKGVLLAGALAILMTAAGGFRPNMLNALPRLKRYPRQRVSDTFSRLKREGLIKTTVKNHQLYIELTPKGRAKAGWLQINDLRICQPRRWDGKWRLVIFDIAELKKAHREAFRGKLKELGFKPLQKSVWLHPFPCQDEIFLLRDFFGLTKQDVIVAVVEKLENDRKIRSLFNL